MASPDLATRFPSLGTSLATPADDVAFQSPGGLSDPSTRSILSAVLSQSSEDTLRRGHERVLQAFAAFVLEFTGEEEITYELNIHDPPQRTADRESTRIVNGRAHDAPRPTAGIHGQSQLLATCSIDTTQTPSRDTDFVLIIDFGNNDNPFVSESQKSKPFIVRLDAASISVDFCRILIPHALEGSVFGALVCGVASAMGCQVAGPRPQLSALNHPPQADPPAWDNALGSISDGMHELLHSAFSRRANEHPEHAALEFLGDMGSSSSTYTYRELDMISSALAREILSVLRTDNTKGQRILPVLLSTSAELYISWLAVLKSGCAFCPLPVEAPAEFISDILEETAATLVLGRGSQPDAIRSYLTSTRLRWIDVQAFTTGPPTAQAPSHPSLPSPSQNDVAYVMYTSGSTGKPKGVAISHQSAVCTIASHIVAVPHVLEWKGTLRWFQFAAPTFDPSVMEIFVTLSTGATLCSCERLLALTNPEAAISKLQATIMMATPSMAALLRPDHVPSLRYLWTMGETLGRTVIDRFASDSASRMNGHDRILVNAYGPTEGSINCTLHANVSQKQRGSVIGQPLQTCSMLVLDPSARAPTPVPLGFPGELAIGGPQVSIGYLNRPEQTAAAFVESEKYGRVYRTGDKARVVQDQDGSLVIDFLGRITTDQVKLSGRRVDLGDIEAAMSNHLVHEAAAVVSSSSNTPRESSGSEQIVVFLVPHQPWDPEAIVDLCTKEASRLLQPYMRPSRYFIIESMPRSTSGKLNRKALKAMLTSTDLTSFLPSLPEDEELEDAVDDDGLLESLRNALAEITNASSGSISPSTVLLSLGFDSLRGVKFLQKCREVGLGELSITDVLSARTLKDLLTQFRRKDINPINTTSLTECSSAAQDFANRHLETCAQTLSIPAADLELILPTTSTQAGMLASFLRSLDSGERQYPSNKSYINHSVYTIAPGNHPDTVCQAWTNVFRRHEMTRTAFVQVDDGLTPFAHCVVSSSSAIAGVTWLVHTCNSDTAFDEALEQATDAASHSIVLERPPLCLSVVHSPSRSSIILSMFHGVFDGGSLQLLLEDISREYQGLPQLPRTGIEVAVKRHFSSHRSAAAHFWLSSLQGNASSPFPNLRATITKPGKRVCKTAYANSDLTLEAIRSSAATIQCSPLAVLHSAWSLILYSYTGCPADVTFGSVISDRFSDDLERCSAPTFTTVPIRVNFDAYKDKSNLDIVRSLTTLNSTALGHLHTPLSSVLTANGRLPYDTLFAFQEFPHGSGGGQEMYSKVDFPVMLNDFVVMVEVWPTSIGTLELKATYDFELLDASAAKMMLEQLNKAITYVLSNPEALFADGQSAFPKAMLSEAGNQGATQSSTERMLLHQPFERHAVGIPDKLALLFRSSMTAAGGEIRMTYRELNQRAEDVANHLQGLLDTSSDEDKVIPICMTKCPDLYVAILGILKAGAAWCPIDPTFPPVRQRHLIERTGSRIVLISSSTLLPSLDALPSAVETIDFADAPWAHSSGVHSSLSSKLEPMETDLAYLIFTSGTTGPPKGVPISHRAASSAMKALEEIIPGASNGEVLCMQFSQYTFDVFVQDLFYTWRMGGTVISATHELMSGAFADLANATKATHAHLTPAFGASIRRKDLETLQVTTMIGEKLPQTVANDWGEAMKAYNTYGPAEAAVVSSVQQFGGVEDLVRSSNIGYPLSSVHAYVMQNGRPVMKNGVGELVLGGVQLARGYWRDPEITDKKFVWNEFAGSTIYHTGDIVRQLADGSFDFVGRNDDLVKINGMRVELSEIAATCRDCHELVDQVEVMYASLPGTTEKAVVCFIGAASLEENDSKAGSVIRGGEGEDLTRCARKWAQAHLPKYMVPDLFIVLNAIPRTPSAKVDRKALLALLETIDTSNVKHDEGAERGDLVDPNWLAQHSALLNTLRSVSKFPGKKIGPTTELSDVGIDSIGSITLSSRLKKEGHAVSVLNVLRCTTVSEIADLISDNGAKGDSGDAWKHQLSLFDASWRQLVYEALGTSDFKLAPATIMQEGVLTESMRKPLSYWGNYFCTLSDSVNHEELKRAWSRVLANTEALCASFLPTASLPDTPAGGQHVIPTFLQIIRPTTLLPWAVEEIDNEDRVAFAWQVFEGTAREHHSQGFSAAPWKVTILKTPSSTTMLVTMHHSIYDADSIIFLLQDVAASYSELTHNSQRCQLSEAVARTNLVDISDKPLAFWTEVLATFSEADEAKAGFTSRAGSAHRTQEARLGLSLSRLRSAARELGVNSINALFRVAWGSMLAELSESSRFLFAEIRSDRILDGRLADTIAPLVSTIPVPFIAEGSPRDLIATQDKLLSESLRNRHIRPGVVRELVQKPPSEPLYPAVFVFHPEQQDRNEQTTSLWTPAEEAFDIAVEHPLALNVFEKEDDSVVLSMSVDARLMNAPAQQCFLRGIDALIDTMLQQPDASSVLHLTECFPLHLQSISTRNPDSNCPAEWQPTHWVEHWAKENPDWVAAEIAEEVDLEDIRSTSWTYSELNAEANRIAAWIKSHDVESSAIGVCLDRDLMSLAVILGIMKSGNTYVPIEEGLPLERKTFLLEDSDAALLFTKPDLFKQGSKRTNTKIVDVTDASILTSIKAMSASNPEKQGDLTDDVYLLYTSGSTGKPKGVQVNRRNLSSFMEAQSALICREASATRELGGTGKYLCLASRAFDVHIGEMFLAWRHGLSAVTGSRLLLLDNLALCLKAMRITHASFVPSLLDQTGLTPSDTPDLVYLGVGGEKMTPRTQDIWSSSQHVNLVNAYGPTEVTVGCCSGRVYPNSDPRNIGKPLGDSVAHVFIPGTEIHVKRGMPGELAFTGSLVATGYHNRHDAQGFVTNKAGERMYRTGDIVCMAPDESIIFMGRKDDQVKVRGQRLELGEISEAVRTASPDPIDVATLLMQHPHISRPQLVSFIAAAGNKKKTEVVFLSDQYERLDTRLRGACELVLPAYMVPDLLIPISRIPLTQTSAKADNKMLKALFQAIPSSLLFQDGLSEEANVSRELTATERQVAEVLQHEAAQSNVQTLKPSTSIFQLSIDSLRAINVSVRLRKAGFEITVANILQNPTIEQLASFSQSTVTSGRLCDSDQELRAAHADMENLEEQVRKELAARETILDSDIAAVRPCLPLQEALVAHSIANKSEGDHNYINHIVFNIDQSIEIDALIRSWDAVISVNEVLRTTFCCLKRDIVQVVLRAEASRRPWTRLEIAPSMLQDSLRSIRPVLAKDILESLETAPPLRFTIASSGQHSRLLMLSIHHSLYDMESLGMLMKDVQDTYTKQEPTLRPATAALYEHLVLAKRHSERARKHWMTIFQNWLYTPLPALQPGAPVQEATRVFSTSLQELETLCSSSGFILAALTQSVFGYALAKTRSQDDVVFGTVLSGRSIAVDGIENMLIPCITTVPHRVDLRASGNSLGDLAGNMQTQHFGSLEYQHTPLRDIQAWVGASGPLFDTIFSFVRTTIGASEDRTGEILALVEDEMSLEYALAVECEANSASNEIVLRGRAIASHGSSWGLDSLLEQVETLTNAVAQGNNVPIMPSELLASSQEPSKRQVYDETSWTSLEEQIRDAIVAFFDVNSGEVAKNTSFIRLGIDSISSIRFAKELRQVGLAVSSADVVRNPSVGALAHYIKERLNTLSNASKTSNGSGSGASGVELSCYAKAWSPEDRIVTAFPLTPLQTGMITSTLTYDAKLYSHHHAFVLSRDIDLARLQEAWKLLLIRHEILRTSFHPSQKASSNWVGAVHQEPMMQWSSEDVDSVDRGLQQLAEGTTHSDHASFAVPPVKATILKDSQQALFVVSLHHVTYDGVSVNFIFGDLLDLYNGTSLLQRPPFSMAAAAIWKSSQESTAFWSHQIQGYKSFDLVCKFQDLEELSMASCTLCITNDVSTLVESCLRSDVTVQTAALVAFGKALCCLRGVRDVVFGQVVAGRSIAVDGADMISGPMFNTVPFRLRLPNSAESNEGLLRLTQNIANQALSFEHVSLAEVQKRWRGQSQSNIPLFDSIFVFQRNQAAKTETSQAPWRKFVSKNDDPALAPSEYNMNFELHQQDDGTLVVQAFSKLPQRQLEEFVNQFKNIMEDLLQRPESLATAFPEQLSQLPVEPKAVDTPASGIDAGNVNTEALAKFFAIVQGILAEVANVPKNRIKPTTSVFSIGLDSILAIRVSSDCRKAGVFLGAADVIRAITVGKICETALANFNKAQDKKTAKNVARALIAPDVQQTALSRLGLQSDAVEDIFPVLPGQEYHLVSWLKSGRTLYEPSWVFRTRKTLDSPRLQQAWAELRRRHPVLRSCFVSFSKNQVLQVVLPPTSVSERDSTTTVDRVGDGATDLETKTRSTIRNIASRPSSLFTPPVRLMHIQGGEEGDAVAITVHHAAYDAWTMVRLIPELVSLYSGQNAGTARPSFSGFVHQVTKDRGNAEEESYWKGALVGSQPTIVQPRTALAGPHNELSRKQTFVMVSGSHTDLTTLEQVSREARTTPQSILLLAFSRLLASETDSQHPVFGYFQTGRSASFDNIECLSGPCLNMLPIAVPSDPSQANNGKGGLRDSLASVRESMTVRMAHEQSYLRDVLRWMGHDGEAPFNTYLNILWNDELFIPAQVGEKEDLLQPMPIGVPTDYSLQEAIPGETSVDELDTSIIRNHNIFVDVGPNRKTGKLEFGSRCDAALMEGGALEEFVEKFDKEVDAIVTVLSSN